MIRAHPHSLGHPVQGDVFLIKMRVDIGDSLPEDLPVALLRVVISQRNHFLQIGSQIASCLLRRDPALQQRIDISALFVNFIYLPAHVLQKANHRKIHVHGQIGQKQIGVQVVLTNRLKQSFQKRFRLLQGSGSEILFQHLPGIVICDRLINVKRSGVFFGSTRLCGQR